MNKKETDSEQVNHLPHRVRLPGLVTDEDIGLGDAIKHVTYSVVSNYDDNNADETRIE